MNKREQRSEQDPFYGVNGKAHDHCANCGGVFNGVTCVPAYRDADVCDECTELEEDE
jgi:hypothetical protein